MFDTKYIAQFSALMNIVKTFIVILALMCGAILFSSDAARMVISPIERMTGLVKELANGETVPARDFEKETFFENCLFPG